MRRARKIAIRTSATLLAFLALFWIICLDEVDHEPYFRTAYYRRTIEELKQNAATNLISSGELSAGFGKARLTPEINVASADPKNGKFRQMPLAGYGNRDGKPATGTHDDLYVKAAALRVGETTAVMFGIDALIVPRPVADQAAARLNETLGLHREQLYFSATHTHCSLGAWGEGFVGELFAGEFDPGAIHWFVECILNAAREAMDDLKPSEIAQGSFSAPQFVRNRLVGDFGNIDPEFAFAILKQTNGRTAVLGSFSAHATVLSGRIMEFSADYPGYWQRAVEAEPGTIAIFLAGAVGSHGPVPGASDYEGAERMGKALADQFRNTSASFTKRIELGISSVNLTLPPLNVRLSDDTRLRPWLSEKLLPPSNGSFVQALRLGKTIWISTPCDFSGELALGIKDFLRPHGYRAVITSFNGDYIGYVIPSHYYHLDGYEPRIMSFYGPNVPDYLTEIIHKLALDLVSTPSEFPLDSTRAREAVAN